MSVFHRLDDITVLDGPTFFRLAWRLPAYEGVMRVRAQEAEDDSAGAPHLAPTGGPPAQSGTEWNPGTRATLMADPALQGIFTFG